MKILPVSDSAIAQALVILRQGGTVLHATETCYGITCDVSNRKAVSRLFAVKRRPISQPIAVLFRDIAQARKYLRFSPPASALALTHLPGPLTLVLPRREDAPSDIFVAASDIEASPMVGLRISPHPIAAALTADFGSPIATTSANVHGKPEAYSVAEILAQFTDDPKPDLVLDSGELPHNLPTTVVEVQGDDVRVLREGTIKISS